MPRPCNCPGDATLHQIELARGRPVKVCTPRAADCPTNCQHRGLDIHSPLPQLRQLLSRAHGNGLTGSLSICGGQRNRHNGRALPMQFAGARRRLFLASTKKRNGRTASRNCNTPGRRCVVASPFLCLRAGPCGGTMKKAGAGPPGGGAPEKTHANSPHREPDPKPSSGGRHNQ